MDKMLRYVCLLLFSLLLSLVPAQAQAQIEFRSSSDTCIGLSWNPNTEPDLAGYRIYWRHSIPGVVTTWQQAAQIAAPRTKVTCEEIQWSILGRKEYALSAYDLSGNESGKSIPVIGTSFLPLKVRSAPTETVEYFLQDAEGLVVLEAEHYHMRTSSVNSQEWVNPAQTPAGASAGGAMVALPNVGSNINTDIENQSPRLDYRVVFLRAGVHYIWVRAGGDNQTDDSVHVGLNGVVLDTSSMIEGPIQYWSWWSMTRNRIRASINILQPGEHRINVWMREDGTLIDKILLTPDEQYSPDGIGPQESLTRR